MLVITQPFMIVKFQFTNAGLVRIAVGGGRTIAVHHVSRWGAGVSAPALSVSPPPRNPGLVRFAVGGGR